MNIQKEKVLIKAFFVKSIELLPIELLLWKCQLKRKFWNLYTIFTTTMDASLCTLENSDYGLPFLITI